MLTQVYFVRHAQPKHDREDDRTRPLTDEGKRDTVLVLDFLRDKEIDIFYSSPYQRSYDTIASTAAFYDMDIITDERLRERKKGLGGNNHDMFRKRWADHNYHEEGGESLSMVQERNIAALQEILKKNPGKKIVIGTHGTALSTILNYYDNSYGCDDFLRIIDWMPYIIELDFRGTEFVSKTEHLHVEKEFKKSAPKPEDYLFESITEYDIDQPKHYDMKFGGAKKLILSGYAGEKIRVRLASNTLSTLQNDFKVKIDDIKKRISVTLHWKD